MAWDIVAAIVVTATIQSLFGVGILLFGTPILLVLGYDFITALGVLLPISLTVNLLQIFKHYHYIELGFYKKILLLSVPAIIACLFIVTSTKVNIGILVGLFLVLVSFKTVSHRVNALIESMVRYERAYFIVMGIVHGLTNLGGSLLTAIVHSKNYEKDVTRASTAASYGTFALFQLITLLFLMGRLPIAAAHTLQYMILGVGMFLATEHLLYDRISTERYRAVFAVFLFVSGVVLIAKTVAS